MPPNPHPHVAAGYPHFTVSTLETEDGELDGWVVNAHPIPDLAGWRVRLRLNKTAEVDSLLLEHAPLSDGERRSAASQALLRKIPLKAILHGMDGPLGRSQGAIDMIRLMTVDHPSWLVPKFPDAPITAGRPGRRGRPDIEWARISQSYVENRINGGSMADLAQLLGLDTAQQASERVREARRRKYLTKTTKGLSGGELTPLAKQILRMHSEGDT